MRARRAPVFDQEVFVLRAILVGLCALVLAAQAVAAASGERPASAAPTAKKSKQATQKAQGGAKARKKRAKAARARTLEARLALKLRAQRKHRSVIRFFKTHRALVSSEKHGARAREALQRARRGLVKTTKEVAYYRRLIRERDERLRIRRLKRAAPPVAICGVFKRHCKQALEVAWCESRWSTEAVNGQYLGLFQMGAWERRLYGHGRTGYEQALAAHRYFVESGRDWSPWSCRWAAS